MKLVAVKDIDRLGPSGSQHYRAGDVLDVDNDKGAKLIAEGLAVRPIRSTLPLLEKMRSELITRKRESDRRFSARYLACKISRDRGHPDGRPTFALVLFKGPDRDQVIERVDVSRMDTEGFLVHLGRGQVIPDLPAFYQGKLPFIDEIHGHGLFSPKGVAWLA